MNRNVVIVGSCLSAIALIGVGQLYREESPPEMKSPVVRAVPPRAVIAEAAKAAVLTPEQKLAALIPGLKDVSEEKRLEAMDQLFALLGDEEFLKAPISDETRKELSAALIKDYAQLADDGKGPDLKVKTVDFIATRGQGEGASTFIQDVLAEGPDDVREAALDGIGRKGGVHGKDVYEKVLTLNQQGTLPPWSVPGALRRTGGKEAIGPIGELMRSTSDWQTVGACVVALQDYGKPELIGPGLERLEQLGLLDRPGRLPWFNASLVAHYMQGAQGDDKKRGLKLLAAKPNLVEANFTVLQQTLDDKDPEARRIAAVAIQKAVSAKMVDTKQAETALASRLQKETEPVLKAALAGALAELRQGDTQTDPGEESAPMAHAEP